jgi:hypothetical protein
MLFNIWKPTGYVMHQLFDNQYLHILSKLFIYLFYIYLRTNSDVFHYKHKLIGSYNRDVNCLLRLTNWPLNKGACSSYLKD